ncbi:MAG TPA: hypothetical protein VK638_39355 [Edaphobacter sp.]|nr:hypothetical protein [Edaphobacter sp.]
MNVDEFLINVATSDVRLALADDVAPRRKAPETVDALFYMPLLAISMMIIARRTPFRTVALGRSVAALLVEHFSSLRRSTHGLETSITLRRRCADALAFLEASQLVSVSEDRERTVVLTDLGKKHVDGGMREASDLGLLMRQLRTSQERVKARFGTDGR